MISDLVGYRLKKFRRGALVIALVLLGISWVWRILRRRGEKARKSVPVDFFSQPLNDP